MACTVSHHEPRPPSPPEPPVQSTSGSTLDPAHDLELHLAAFSFATSIPADSDTIATELDRRNAGAASRYPLFESAATLLRLAELVKLPRTFTTDDSELDSASLVENERFSHHLPSLLRLSLAVLRLQSPTTLTIEERCTAFLAFSRWAPLAPMDTSTVSVLSSSLCEVLLAPCRHQLLDAVLSRSFPSYFKPHPRLNPETGRLLSRPRGGDQGMMNYYEEGAEEEIAWRNEPGMANSVGAILGQLDVNEIEDRWRYILPPLLAFLDDYSPSNKILGLRLLRILLLKVDASLLRRTGVGEVFQQSIAAAFSSLSSPSTPVLLLEAHATSLQLINLLYPALSNPLPSTIPQATRTLSATRYDKLCTLLEQGVIHPWEFKGGQLEIELAVLDCLPALLLALGTGSIRYLQILLPHLTALLAFTAPTTKTTALYAKAALGVGLIIQLGEERIPRWRGSIISSVAKCWINLREEEDGQACRVEKPGETDELEAALKLVLRTLGEKDPVALKVDIPRLGHLAATFEELVKQ